MKIVTYCIGKKLIGKKSIECPFKNNCIRYTDTREKHKNYFLVAPFEKALTKYICKFFIKKEEI